MPLKESRRSGFIGAVLLCIVSIVLFVFFPNGAPSAADGASLTYAAVVGLPALFAFIFLLWAVEEFSKTTSARSTVDSYVLALGFGGASYGVARLIGVASPVSPSLPIGHAYSFVLPPNSSADLDYIAFLLLLLIGAGLLAWCYWLIGRKTGERLFMVVGAMYVAAGLSSPFSGSVLFDLAPFPLAIAFSQMGRVPNPAGDGANSGVRTRRWYDVPKILVSVTSRLWVADEGIFKVMPALASITLMVLAIYYVVGDALNLARPLDASGFQPPLPAPLVFGQGLAVCGALCAFVLVSRWRYPNLTAEDVIRRSRIWIPWDSVSAITPTPVPNLKTGAGKMVMNNRVTITAGNKTYSGIIAKTDLPKLMELAKAKLGDRLRVSE